MSFLEKGRDKNIRRDNWDAAAWLMPDFWGVLFVNTVGCYWKKGGSEHPSISGAHCRLGHSHRYYSVKRVFERKTKTSASWAVDNNS